MTYPEAILFLYNLRIFGTKLGLENTRELSRLAGNPHEGLQFIHVAGTNGKGSTCAILESIYRANGQRTGLFTSPHLVSFTERMQVNRSNISESEVARLTGELIELLGGNDVSKWAIHPTFFEFVAVMALRYFREQRCEVVIWETGMGGRLDATNIVTPLASVITNIQYDHQQWLGNTLEAIAGEKAGIIKPNVPVVTGVSTGPALEVIRATADRNHAPLTIVSEPVSLPAEVALRGEHQKLNASIALATVEAVGRQIPVSRRAIARGLETVNWSGRLQLLRQGDCDILLDGAHNADGIQTLCDALSGSFADRKITLILGLFRDKPWREMCQLLLPLVDRLLLVPLHSDRTADIQEVRGYCHEHWPNLRIETFETTGKAIDAAVRDERFVVIAGSLHLVGEAMEHLQIVPSAGSERSLNEWNAANAAAP